MKEKVKRLLYKSFNILERPAKKKDINQDALAYLQTQYPLREISFVTDNRIATVCDLLVIIPVYNVEKYIRKCINSLVEQKTKYSVQMVIVDDGATDLSGKIADEYASLTNVEIIHKKNGGLSEARNYGMKKLTGRYITFVDSDDYIPSQDVFEKMLDAAYEKNADIVAARFLRFVENNGGEEQIIDQKLVGHKHLENIDPIRELQGFAWGKLYKAELFKDIKFPVGYWYEDTIIPWLVFTKANTTVYADVICYAYRNNPSGITASGLFSPRAIESTYLTKKILERIEIQNSRKDDYYYLFIVQTLINLIRVRNASDEIQYAVFSIMCNLQKKFFGEERIQIQMEYKHKEMEIALNTCDYDKMKRIIRWL